MPHNIIDNRTRELAPDPRIIRSKALLRSVLMEGK